MQLSEKFLASIPSIYYYLNPPHYEEYNIWSFQQMKKKHFIKSNVHLGKEN